MTTLVTPVGTSLFTNYLDNNPSNSGFSSNYDTIKNCPATAWSTYDIEIDDLRKDILAFISKFKVKASAELQSIAKIRDELKEDIIVKLLASDTIASRLAAEILTDKEATKVLGNNVSVKFNAETDVIEGLQIKSTKEFNDTGMPTLMRKISQLEGQLVMNITGGYKAAIPYLTIFSQIDRIPLFYTFEDLDEESPDLIRIPQVPLSVDWQLVQYYEHVFSKIDKGIEDWTKFEQDNDVAIKDLRGCIEVADNIAAFSWFGERFWQHYKNNYRVEIDATSYLTHIKVWHGINTAIEDLYSRLNSALSPSAFKEPCCFETIKELDQQNNLNHGGPINNRTFIFKTQRTEPIRFAYSFTVNDKEVTSITIFEILRQSFNHKAYVANFKKKYRGHHRLAGDKSVTLTLPKPTQLT